MMQFDWYFSNELKPPNLYSQVSQVFSIKFLLNTPLKTNMSPENRWLEDVFPTEMVTF